VLTALPGVAGSINLMSRLRVLAMTSPYPHNDVGRDGTLPIEVIARLGAKHRIAPWTGLGALYGDPKIVAAAKKIVKRILGPMVSGLRFVTPQRAGIAGKAARFVPGKAGRTLGDMVAALHGSLDILLGRPSEVALPLAYWKRGLSAAASGPLDPARDGCGLIWYSPLVLMKASVVREYVSHVETICRAHGIEPLITLTALSDRCFDSSVPLLFDLQDPIQLSRAGECYQALFEAGRQKGFVPYRLGTQIMETVTASDAVCWDLVGRLKAALDPEGIIAPGRYAPTARTT
jgi:hypothetical protein